MAEEWKREYECICRDGSSEFYDDKTDAIAFAEQEQCERIEVIIRYLDEREIFWVRDWDVEEEA